MLLKCYLDIITLSYFFKIHTYIYIQFQYTYFSLKHKELLFVKVNAKRIGSWESILGFNKLNTSPVRLFFIENNLLSQSNFKFKTSLSLTSLNAFFPSSQLPKLSPLKMLFAAKEYSGPLEILLSAKI